MDGWKDDGFTFLSLSLSLSHTHTHTLLKLTCFPQSSEDPGHAPSAPRRLQ